jgi:hypothetical protein
MIVYGCPFPLGLKQALASHIAYRRVSKVEGSKLLSMALQTGKGHRTGRETQAIGSKGDAKS